MIPIKVCGITRVEDALIAADAGVTAVGFNFVRHGPRAISAAQAAEIGAALPGFIMRIGIFANEPVSSLVATAREARLHCLQFHGEESPDQCAASPLPWFKAHRVAPGFRLETLRRYASSTFLLDASAEGALGGTGHTFDWDIAARAGAHGRVVLAGGLRPDNIAEALRVAHPYAVDVNSGIEVSPGVKSAELLKRFVEAVREFETNPEGRR